MSEFGQAVRHFWTLDWSATHLNHGSYGATPKPVLAAQDAVRQDMERTIGDFFSRQLPKRMRSAAAELANISAPSPTTSSSSTTPPPAPRPSSARSSSSPATRS